MAKLGYAENTCTLTCITPSFQPYLFPCRVTGERLDIIVWTLQCQRLELTSHKPISSTRQKCQGKRERKKRIKYPEGWCDMMDYPEGRNSARPNKGLLLPALQVTSLQLTQIQYSTEEWRPASTAPHSAQLAALHAGVGAGQSCNMACV